MKIVRVYTGADGESHFEDLSLDFVPEGLVGALTPLQPATGIRFRETGPDYDYDWHTAPRRQYVINLTGGVEIEVGDGSTRRLGAGDVLLAEDVSGRGHRSRAIGKAPRLSVFVTLD